jgi:hypothetical protein
VNSLGVAAESFSVLVTPKMSLAAGDTLVGMLRRLSVSQSRCAPCREGRCRWCCIGRPGTDATSPVQPDLELINELPSLLKQGHTQLTDAARQDVKNAETALSLVSSEGASTALPDLKAADLASLVTATKKDGQNRSKQATAAVKTLDGALRILTSDLEAMKKRTRQEEVAFESKTLLILVLVGFSISDFFILPYYRIRWGCHQSAK